MARTQAALRETLTDLKRALVGCSAARAGPRRARRRNLGHLERKVQGLKELLEARP